MVKRLDYNSRDEVCKKISKKYEGKNDKVSVYGYSTFENIMSYCLHSGIDKFLLNEKELPNYSKYSSIGSNFIWLTNLQIQPKLNNWIIKQIKMLDKEIEEYNGIQNDIGYYCYQDAYFLHFKGNLEEFKKSLNEIYKMLNNVVNQITNNPLQILNKKLRKINEKISKEICLNSKKEILVSDIAYELDKIAIDLQTKLYQEMLEEFPEINEEKSTYMVKNELCDDLKEYDLGYDFEFNSEMDSKFKLEVKEVNLDKWYIEN